MSIQSINSEYVYTNPKLFKVGEIEYNSVDELYKILTKEEFSKQPFFKVTLRDYMFEDARDGYKTNHEIRVRNILKQWEKAGLVKKRDKKGWQKHSFTELIWFRLIMKFKKFGYSTEYIADIYQKIMAPHVSHSIRIKEALRIAGHPTNDQRSSAIEASYYSIIYENTIWTDQRLLEFHALIGRMEQTIPLGDMIVDILNLGVPMLLIANGISVQDTIVENVMNDYDSMIFEDHIAINLTDVVSEFIDGDIKSIQSEKWDSLSQMEKYVLDLIRSSSAQRIIFEYDAKQNLRQVLEESTENPTRLETQYLNEVFKPKKYERIIADSADGELVKFVRIKKTKLKGEN